MVENSVTTDMTRIKGRPCPMVTQVRGNVASFRRSSRIT